MGMLAMLQIDTEHLNSDNSKKCPASWSKTFGWCPVHWQNYKHKVEGMWLNLIAFGMCKKNWDVVSNIKSMALCKIAVSPMC